MNSAQQTKLDSIAQTLDSITDGSLYKTPTGVFGVNRYMSCWWSSDKEQGWGQGIIKRGRLDLDGVETKLRSQHLEAMKNRVRTSSGEFSKEILAELAAENKYVSFIEEDGEIWAEGRSEVADHMCVSGKRLAELMTKIDSRYVECAWAGNNVPLEIAGTIGRKRVHVALACVVGKKK